MEVNCQTVKARMDSNSDFVLLDCREQSEWDGGHIAGAVLIPMSQMRERVTELEGQRDKEIIVYCHHGGRSLRVAGFLRQQGYANTYSMAGGIDDWSVTIDPTIPRY